MKCGSCFRFVEDWRDAKHKGFIPVHVDQGLRLYARKPRPGIEAKCLVYPHAGIDADDKACPAWKHRIVWNMQVWWDWQLKAPLIRWFEHHIRVPLGGLRKPMPLRWTESYDCQTDSPIPEPVCPYCGDMPYSTEQCMFCGQRFVLEGYHDPDTQAGQRQDRSVI